ncbi:MAG: sterol desaturase family protein [Opitutales bacterium]
MNELNIYKPALIALVLGILWTLETIIPEFVERRGRTSHNAHNLALGLLNAGLLSLGFAALLVAVGQWAAGAGFGLLHWIDAPAWIEWTTAILLFDLWMYLWHRANHKIPFLWRFHSVHHSRYQPATDSNYASVFSWWDRIFRSFRLRKDPGSIRLGLDGYATEEWRRLDGMLRSPFRRPKNRSQGTEHRDRQ